MARCRAALVAAVLATMFACAGLGAALASPAGASGAHRALVIVDTGVTTYQRVITFDGSVTGIQALQLAGADPVVYSYAGQGGAVCRLYGVGRDASPSCLGGADGSPAYWAYFRASAGTSSFTYSRAGAGSTQVSDGDVEGWRFGTGQAPAWAPVPPVTTTTTVASPPATAPAATGGAGGAAPVGSGPAPTGPDATRPPTAQELLMIAAARAAASTTTTTRPDGSDAPTEVQAAREHRTDSRTATGALAGSGGDGGGSAGSLVLFAGVLAVLAAAALGLRRSRRRPVP